MVYDAKYWDHPESIQKLAALCIREIRSLPCYSYADYITAVPASPTKTTRDLPSEITALIAQELGLENITGHFRYYGIKPALKGLRLEEKWPALEVADLRYEGCRLDKKKVILVDDLYQSGITMQFVAMKLQQAGAHQIYGLSMAKNLTNTDNQ